MQVKIFFYDKANALNHFSSIRIDIRNDDGKSWKWTGLTNLDSRDMKGDWHASKGQDDRFVFLICKKNWKVENKFSKWILCSKRTIHSLLQDRQGLLSEWLCDLHRLGNFLKLGLVRSKSGWLVFQMPDHAIHFAVVWKGHPSEATHSPSLMRHEK